MTAPPPLDLSTPGRYHVVGIGGPGMSALALVLAEMGHRVSGSDVKESPVLDRLRAAGVDVHVGHDRALVVGVDAVTASTAIPATNIELAAARERGIPTLSRAGMLASICARARGVAVAGTHGKTTTTSMLAMMLTEAGWHPSFVVGGDVNEVGTGAHWSGGDWLVVEADESDGTFLELPLHATIVTNVEVDHLEHFGTFDAIIAAFDRYLAGITGPRVVGIDDEVAAGLAERHDAVTYGTAERARYRAVDVRREEGASVFVLTVDGERRGPARVPLRGLHNVRNATGALAMADQLGVPFEASVSALARFGGVARRFEIRARHQGVTLVDDYAHLPTEIAVVIDAARESGDGWRRVVAVFQPNRFRRMAVMSPEYRDAFTRADLAIITEIYPSGDAPIPGVTGRLVVDAVRAAHPDLDVRWIPKRAELIEFLAGELSDGDVCISMGCGDVASLPTEVLALRLERETSA
ncbi:MAG: UDP-N-acetylmuramate--alanine ligase [Acidimicrobiaceae bacterium]|nr:UDP-N-acetylmuramate--alanine ligase [Acidimicrobiaceae bacterium]